MAANESSSEYDVGFGKPPKQTRFQKGISGNPKGRPPGADLTGDGGGGVCDVGAEIFFGVLSSPGRVSIN